MEAPMMPPGGNISRAAVLMVPTIITVVIATILTGLRLYVRMRLLKRLEWDDFFNVLALIFVLVVLGLTAGAASNGFGRHIYYLDLARASFAIELLRVCEFFLIMSTVFLKISISLFLKRLFLTSKRWAYFLWAFIAFNTITSLIDAAIIFPQCSPVQRNWDHSVQGKCWSDEAISATGVTQGSIAAATDFTLSLLPIVFLWNIRIHWNAKVGICGVMALGFASGSFAIARTVLVPGLTTSKDPTWDLINLFLWAVLEATIGVIAAAAPSVRPLFVRNAMSSGSARYKLDFMPHHTPRKVHPNRLSWYGHAIDSEMGNLTKFDDAGSAVRGDAAERMSDSGSSNEKAWCEKARPSITNEGGSIMKTTDVSVTHSPNPMIDGSDGHPNPQEPPASHGIEVFDGAQ